MKSKLACIISILADLLVVMALFVSLDTVLPLALLFLAFLLQITAIILAALSIGNSGMSKYTVVAFVCAGIGLVAMLVCASTCVFGGLAVGLSSYKPQPSTLLEMFQF